MSYFIDYWDKRGETNLSHYTWSCGDDYKEACKIYERLKKDYKHVHLKKRYYTNGINSHDHYDEVYQSYDESKFIDYWDKRGDSKEDGTMKLSFDEGSMYWAANPEWNEKFLVQTEKEINDFIENKGYIYLNQIYEHLGIPWDPEKENVLFKKPLEFDNEARSLVLINFKEAKDV